MPALVARPRPGADCRPLVPREEDTLSHPLPWLLASAHLLGLGIGLGAVWARARALRGVPGREALRAVFAADTWWAVAAGVWLSTGLVRLFLATEKPTAYYLQNHFFWTKIALLVVILVLEVPPMVGLIRWRRVVAKGDMPDTSKAARWALTSDVQAWLVVLMVFAATGMARGYGMLR
jgi:putative membrane protein